MVARRIYGMLLILAIIIGVYFYGIAREKYDAHFLIFFSLVPYLMFAGAAHGLIAHGLPPAVKGKGHSVYYPLAMGAVFVILFLIHVFLVLPMVCPDFLKGLR